MFKRNRGMYPVVYRMCMGGGGGDVPAPTYKPPDPPPPPPPQTLAPVMQFATPESQASTQASGKRVGKAKLQIPLGGANASTGLGIPTP